MFWSLRHWVSWDISFDPVSAPCLCWPFYSTQPMRWKIFLVQCSFLLYFKPLWAQMTQMKLFREQLLQLSAKIFSRALRDFIWCRQETHPFFMCLIVNWHQICFQSAASEVVWSCLWIQVLSLIPVMAELDGNTPITTPPFVSQLMSAQPFFSQTLQHEHSCLSGCVTELNSGLILDACCQTAPDWIRISADNVLFKDLWAVMSRVLLWLSSLLLCFFFLFSSQSVWFSRSVT